MKKYSFKKGIAFSNVPKRILFGRTETQRKNHYKKQFSMLINHWNQVPWRQWGIGSARTLSNLLREIGLGETVLQLKKGELIRSLDIVIVFLFTKDGKWLTEEPQEMYDGRIRNRRFPYISEKVRLGENPMDTALRAIKEETGGVIDPQAKRLINGELHILDNNHPYNTGSSSYPGLKSHKKAYTFAYIINEKEYKHKYVEVDITGSVTIHSWKSVTENVWYTDTSLEKKVTNVLPLSKKK